jgi:branched-chain amino acid transport system permease protein
MLLTSGLSLLFGIASIASFMHGEMATIGGYVLLFLLLTLSVDPMLTIICSMAIMFFIGILFGTFFFKRLRKRIGKGWISDTFIITLGLSQILVNGMLIVFGSSYQGVKYLYPGSVTILDVPISTDRALLIVFSISILVLLWLFLKYHRVGRAIRAVGINEEVGPVLGIDVDRIYLLVIGISTMLAGIAGGFYMALYTVYPTMGGGPNLKSWVIVIFGGLGNIKGALICSIILASIETLAYYYVSGGWQDVVSFAVLLAVILIRPYGLFGKGGRDIRQA